MSCFCCCRQQQRRRRANGNNNNNTTFGRSSTELTKDQKTRMEFLENVLPITIIQSSFNKDDDHDQSSCLICLMDYSSGDILTSSHNPNCSHIFHRDCIKSWLLTKSDCPCCRKDYLSFEDEDDGIGNEENGSSPSLAVSAILTGMASRLGRRIRDDFITRLVEPILSRLEQQQREQTLDPNNNVNNNNNNNNTNNASARSGADGMTTTTTTTTEQRRNNTTTTTTTTTRMVEDASMVIIHSQILLLGMHSQMHGMGQSILDSISQCYSNNNNNNMEGTRTITTTTGGDGNYEEGR